MLAHRERKTNGMNDVNVSVSIYVTYMSDMEAAQLYKLCDHLCHKMNDSPDLVLCKRPRVYKYSTASVSFPPDEGH